MTETDRVPVPGARDVRATLHRPSETTTDGTAVVACPPHPEYGGRRTDRRVVAVAEVLAAEGVATLAVDYGPWDGGAGERADARAALRWAGERYTTVGVFGYSFGGWVALHAAADETRARPAAVSVLAPADDAGTERASSRVGAVTGPLQVVYGERDGTVDWRAVADAADEAGGGATVSGLPAAHRFVGRTDDAAARVGEFLTTALARAGDATN